MTRFGDNGVVGYGSASRSSGRCAACRGTGQVVEGGATRGTVPTTYRCTACQGTMNCPICRGTGISAGGQSSCPCCYRG
jgi:hypothetical protein